MEHTYFVKTLDWKAAGTYYDESGNEYPLKGEVSVVKSDREWTLGGYLEVLFDTPVRFTNDYKIQSTAIQSTLAWESYNPALGVLKGTFEFIGNCIISLYHSDDGVYSGTETLIQRSESVYDNVGASFCNGKKMSSWTATIVSK